MLLMESMRLPGKRVRELLEKNRDRLISKTVTVDDIFASINYLNGLGHGVGLETHEAPSLSPRAEGLLEPGMVVTVEPGLYYPAWGGVRWEYTVLVEEDGVRIL